MPNALLDVVRNCQRGPPGGEGVVVAESTEGNCCLSPSQVVVQIAAFVDAFQDDWDHARHCLAHDLLRCFQMDDRLPVFALRLRYRLIRTRRQLLCAI